MQCIRTAIAHARRQSGQLPMCCRLNTGDRAFPSLVVYIITNIAQVYKLVDAHGFEPSRCLLYTSDVPKRKVRLLCSIFRFNPSLFQLTPDEATKTLVECKLARRDQLTVFMHPDDEEEEKSEETTSLEQ